MGRKEGRRERRDGENEDRLGGGIYGGKKEGKGGRKEKKGK